MSISTFCRNRAYMVRKIMMGKPSRTHYFASCLNWLLLTNCFTSNVEAFFVAIPLRTHTTPADSESAVRIVNAGSGIQNSILNSSGGATKSSSKKSISMPMARKVPEYSVIDDDDEDDGKDYTVDNVVTEDSSTGDSEEAGSGNDSDEFDEEEALMSASDWKQMIKKRKSPGRTSWMDKNAAFSGGGDEKEDDEGVYDDSKASQARKNRGVNKEGGYNDPTASQTPKNRSFRNDFRGTRVFVQGLPLDATWQDLKDHFGVAGEVVFASVSVDRRTGESKGCGIVQFETTEMALKAIKVMRDYPLDGHALYVREDVQEQREGAQLRNPMPRQANRGGLTTPPSKWECADERNFDLLSDEEKIDVLELLGLRDNARRRRDYDMSDKIREKLKNQYRVHMDDRLKKWWVSTDGNFVPQSIKDIKGSGRWGAPKPWRMIPTTPENDARVNPDLVGTLLHQRDLARKNKDFATADALLEEARSSPDGNLYLRIHDESRTWRIWTDEPPPRPVAREGVKSAAEQCVDFVKEVAPEKEDEIRSLLLKFPGREYNILKKLKKRYK